MITTTQFQLVPIDKLIPYANNARTHSPAQIKKLRASIREFGFLNPVIIDANNGVIAGHGRIVAAKEEGFAEVPCVLADHLTEAQKKAYILADNRMALDAGWDEMKLKLELEQLDEMNFDLNLTGFEDVEIKSLFEDDVDVQDDNYDVETELLKPTFSRGGDVWTIGRHRLVCGDSTDPDVYALLMEDRKANLVVTDPPYNVAYEGKTKDKLTIENDSMSADNFYEFLLAAFQNMESVMADDASIYVFHADTEGLNFRKAFIDAGFHLSGCCIWKKPLMVLGRSPYQWQHEPCLYGWKKKGKHQWYSDRKQTTIWEFSRPSRSAEHPTMKPIPLLVYPITNSSMRNTIILDPFGGSGSTLIACEQTDRSCYTIELDPKYCDVIVQRYIKHAGSFDDVSVVRDGQTVRFSELNIPEK